jgi:hypothetical protein
MEEEDRRRRPSLGGSQFEQDLETRLCPIPSFGLVGRRHRTLGIRTPTPATRSLTLSPGGWMGSNPAVPGVSTRSADV